MLCLWLRIPTVAIETLSGAQGDRVSCHAEARGISDRHNPASMRSEG